MQAWRALRGLPREVWVLFGATLVNRMGTMALPFLVLYLTRSLAFTPAGAGAVVALYGACAIASSPFGGRLADRIGPLAVLRGSLFATGTLLLAYPLARSRLAVLAMTGLWAGANELFRPASLSAVAALVPPEKRRSAIALNRLAINLGMSVGPALGGFLASVSFPALFAVDGVTSLLAGAVLLSWRAAPRPGASADGVLVVSRGALGDRRLLFFLAAVVPVGMVFFQHEAAMALYLVSGLGFSERVYGLLFTLNTLIIVALEVPLNAWTAAWPHARSLATGALLVGSGFGLLALARSLPAVALTVVVWTFGEMTLLPAMGAYVADLAPADRRGAYMGLYTMAFSVAFAVGPWLGTLVLARRGAVALWGGCFVFGVVSAIAFARLTEKAKSDVSLESPAP
ncbi:MAG TPA: MFS transporter [Thermoanaerobaculia bacterium]|nr:MFS transporter [Thermoanaerobaculia bacterium]